MKRIIIISIVLLFTIVPHAMAHYSTSCYIGSVTKIGYTSNTWWQITCNDAQPRVFTVNIRYDGREPALGNAQIVYTAEGPIWQEVEVPWYLVDSNNMKFYFP